MNNRLGERRQGRGRGAASEHGVATLAHRRGLDGVAERTMWRENDKLRGGGDNCGTQARSDARRSRRWTEVDDNYGGGDDNYPRVVMKMGAVEREEERGWDRQK
jgi:hypothetical protein